MVLELVSGQLTMEEDVSIAMDSSDKMGCEAPEHGFFESFAMDYSAKDFLIDFTTIFQTPDYQVEIHWDYMGQFIYYFCI